MELTGVFVLVITFIFLLVIGVPIVYSIGLASIATMVAGEVYPLAAATTLSQQMATGVNSFTLLAIPFFIFAGNLMNKGGIANRLIAFAKVCVGMFPGGLAFVNILAAMLFGAISGSAVAAASAIGGFMGKQMREEGYSAEYSTSVNITASTTGLIIPPSNVLIVYSLASGGASIAALFLAGYVPGLLIGLLLMIVGGVIAKKRGYPVGEVSPIGEVFRKFLAALPSLLLLFIIIGGIVSGVFTATEASAIAVAYTLLLSMGIYQEVKFNDLGAVIVDTVKTTAIVMFLIGASVGMSWVMAFENIPQAVTQGLISISENKYVILIIINLILLFVGTFMDMTPAILIFTPILLPVVTSPEVGVDPIHFGILMTANLAVGLCTPPVGTILFVGVGVGKTTIEKVLPSLLPFFVAMLVSLLLITFIEDLSLWLPRAFGVMGN